MMRREVFHRLRYCHLMACAAHLFVLVVVLVLIMIWIFMPTVRQGGCSRCACLFGGVAVVGGVVWAEGEGIMNRFVGGHL